MAALIGLGVDKQDIADAVTDVLGSKVDIQTETKMVSGIACNRLVLKYEDSKHHRDFTTISGMIKKSSLSDKVKNDAVEMFRLVAVAEASVHDKPFEKVHFHEVGANDSIIDIVGVAYALDTLGVDRVISAPAVVGRGFVKCSHGKMPVPAPATLKILSGVPVVRSEEVSEMTTPTGAAVMKYYADDFSGNFSGSDIFCR